MADIDSLNESVNVMFIVTLSIIVFFMQAGFAFLEAGSVRAKNTTNIIVKNIIDAALGSLVYWATGFAFSYGGDSNPFIGTKDFFLAGTDASQYANYYSGYVFAATAATICSGAISERAILFAYFFFTTLMTGFIYPTVVHWVWSDNGWLVNLDYIDFAGSSVVHCVGGTAALVGAIIVGPRIGRFEGLVINPMPGHSVVLVALGFFILWFGFFAFNAVSEGGIVGDGFNVENVERAVVNTSLSAVASIISSLFILKIGISRVERVMFGRELRYITLFGQPWSIIGAMNGGLTGMVAICGGAFGYEPWAGFVIGLIAGAVYTFGARLLLFLRVDDPLEAAAVHLGGGIWGSLAVGLFLNSDRTSSLPDGGILYAWNTKAFVQFGIQAIGVTVIILWSALLCGLLFGFLRLIGMIRCSPETEKEGLDYKDGEPAYPVDPAIFNQSRTATMSSKEYSDSSREDYLMYED